MDVLEVVRVKLGSFLTFVSLRMKKDKRKEEKGHTVSLFATQSVTPISLEFWRVASLQWE
jgi:hypothetical protein